MSVYAVSDLHGCYSVYEKLKAMLKPEDTVYCLGDCGDRGPRSWDTITAIYNDPQFIYLKGNHEDMLVQAIDEWFSLERQYGDNMGLLEWNGGRKTFKEWKRAPERNKWANKLRRLPEEALYVNKNGQVIHLSHAGYTPDENGEHADNADLIWSRNHFWDIWKASEEHYIVHGHTPVKRFQWHGEGYEPTVVEYEHHKIDIDMGCIQFGRAAVLNLDTLEAFYIDADEVKED